MGDDSSRREIILEYGHHRYKKRRSRGIEMSAFLLVLIWTGFGLKKSLGLVRGNSSP